ncbi:MAG: hypothetical protein M1832_004284 [Thelocarpon impressellum]|nr:MAG: hypothetical protein M1832_004284 [Thelocarpon impressellum]
MAATAFMQTDLLGTPGFFSAALAGEEHNVFESSFKAGNASIERAHERGDATPPATRMLAQHEDLLRTAATGTFSPLFGLSPGVSPMPFELDGQSAPDTQAQSPEDLAAASRSSAWSAMRGTLQLTHDDAAVVRKQEPSPPNSALSPPLWTFRDPRPPLLSPLHGFLVDDNGGKTHAHGQITPPNDADPTSAVTGSASRADAAAPLPRSASPKDEALQGQPAAPAPAKRKRGRQSSQTENNEGESGSSAKRRRKSGGKANASVAADEDATLRAEDGQKRSRFLERNRVAASKCRTKKKEWTSNLEARARDLQNEKNQLAIVVGSLRDEVVWLKGELLKHSSCRCDKIRQYLDREIAHLATNPAAGQPVGRAVKAAEPQGSRRRSPSGETPDTDADRSAISPATVASRAGRPDSVHASPSPPVGSEKDRQLYDTLSAEIAR